MRSKLEFMLSMAIFGSIGICVRFIGLPSAEIALFRGLIGSLFLVLVVCLSRRPFSLGALGRNAWFLLASSIALGGNWVFLFQAFKRTTIANAVLSYYLAPVFLVVLSRIALGERISVRKALCVAGAMLGMGCIALHGQAGAAAGQPLIGIALGLLAALSYATLMLLNKFIKGVSGMEATVIQLALATLVLAVYVFGSGEFRAFPMLGATGAWVLIVGIVHTGIGFYLFFSGMQGLGSQTIAAFSYLDPLTALILSRLVFNEHLSGAQILGGCLILGSTLASEVSWKWKLQAV